MVTKLRASYALFVRFLVIPPDMCSFPIQWCKIYDYTCTYTGGAEGGARAKGIDIRDPPIKCTCKGFAVI